MKFLPTGLNWPRIGLTIIAILGLIALIVGGIKSCKQIEADQDNQLVNAGTDKERAQTQGKVLSDVQNAQDAVGSPTANDQQRVCEKYNRNCASRDQ